MAEWPAFAEEANPPWFEYLTGVMPEVDEEGKLAGPWGEFLMAAIDYEVAHADPSDPRYLGDDPRYFQDDPSDQVRLYMQKVPCAPGNTEKWLVAADKLEESLRPQESPPPPQTAE